MFDKLIHSLVEIDIRRPNVVVVRNGGHYSPGGYQLIYKRLQHLEYRKQFL